MKRNYETMSASTSTTTPSGKDVVEEALQKFRTGMNSSLPPLHLREFHSEDKINEVSELERKQVFDDFYPVVIKFRGKRMGEMVTELDSGIERITEGIVKTNRHHEEEVHLLIGKMMDFLCEEFKGWLEIQLSLNPDMGPEQLAKLSGDEKARIIKFFSDHCTQWNADVVQAQVSKLEEKVNQVQREIEENYVGRDVSQSSTSDTSGIDSVAVPIAEKEGFVKLEARILEICEELNDIWVEDSKNLKLEEENDHWEEQGSQLDCYIEQVKKILEDENNNQFSNKDYQEIHDRLKTVLEIATKALSLTWLSSRKCTREKATRQPENHGIQIAATYLHGEDALMWQRAFELDLRNTFPTQRTSNEVKNDCDVFEFWLSKMILKTSYEALTLDSSEREVEGLSSRRKVQEVMKSLELSFGVGHKSNGGHPKLFMERLHGVWDLPNLNSEMETDAEVIEGPSSGQTSK